MVQQGASGRARLNAGAETSKRSSGGGRGGGGDRRYASSGKPNFFKTLRQKPWLVPAVQPLQLVFFRKVFVRLMNVKTLQDAGADNPDEDIPLMIVQRSFARLCRLLRDDRLFDAKRYDLNGDGSAGWWEFLAMWKQEKLCMRLSPMERVYLTLEDPQSSRLGWLTSLFVFVVILVSAGSFVLSTMPVFHDPPSCPSCEPAPFVIFERVDTFCVVLFTVEYVLRFITSAFTRVELTNEEELIDCMTKEETLRSPSGPQRMLTFALHWPNVIDLLAILPSYMSWIMEAFSGGGTPDAEHDLMVKVTRLMRVVRALRLGRRFEAVIIVVNTMKRSIRALWVLILNLTMGVLVWGAILYYLEQGVYDPDTGAFVRPEDNNNPTPFASIPHSFWFAMVTATTVGYGDVVPVTNGGRVVAGLNMVYSLCVLALPIGVIGSNFDVVWKDFDREKRDEQEVRDNAAWMLRDACFALDPLSYSRVLTVEVLHSPMPVDNNDIFLGQASADLDLDANSFDKVDRELTLPLQENRSKGNRAISGNITISYSWRPSRSASAGSVLRGHLTINVLCASELGRIDWKPSWQPDARVRLTFHPRCPGDSSDGVIVPQVEMTHVVRDDRAPTWNCSFSADVAWTRDGINKRRDKERILQSRSAMSLAGPLAPLSASSELSAAAMGFDRHVSSGDVAWDGSSTRKTGLGATIRSRDAGRLGADVGGAMPRLTEEVQSLSVALPMLQGEIVELRRDQDAVLALLGLQPSVPAPIASPRPPMGPGPNDTVPAPHGSPTGKLRKAASFGDASARTLLETVSILADEYRVPGSVLDDIFQWT
mmetsp:Transcript_168694/g.542090  ORF Transcript_168694/g.542090 Transcript_168694/m.542090 type:complete len:822 (+) Transcript_168694:101-2566(+)